MDYFLDHKIRIKNNLGQIIGLAQQIQRVDRRWVYVEEKARDLLEAVRELMSLTQQIEDCGCS